MENFLSIFAPALLLCLLLRLIVLPIKWFWKLLLNSLCGFLCLLTDWLQTIQQCTFWDFTGLYFPVNAVTVIIAGFLGLPGIGILALAQVLL